MEGKKEKTMASYQPYFNRDEFESINKMKNCPEKIQSLKAMADAGNVQAAFVFGDMLMKGIWDIKRMELDVARGQLLPPAPFVQHDPYLILPRNQYQAIEYHKIAANYPYENVCVEITKARAELNYCRLKGNIGYYNHGKLDIFTSEYFYKTLEADASDEDKAANPFLPYPYVRPEVENPKTKVFAHVASKLNIYGLIFALLFQVFAFYAIVPIMAFGSNLNKEVGILGAIIVSQVFTFVLFTIPIIVFFIYNKIYGPDRPLCACPEIRKAYDTAVADLPKDLKQDDPFEGIPAFAKNTISIQLGLHSFYAIAAIIFGVLHFTKILDLAQLSPFLSGGVNYSLLFIAIAFPLITIFTYKNAQKGFVDRICDRELHELTEESDLDA